MSENLNINHQVAHDDICSGAKAMKAETVSREELIVTLKTFAESSGSPKLVDAISELTEKVYRPFITQLEEGIAMSKNGAAVVVASAEHEEISIDESEGVVFNG